VPRLGQHFDHSASSTGRTQPARPVVGTHRRAVCRCVRLSMAAGGMSTTRNSAAVASRVRPRQAHRRSGRSDAPTSPPTRHRLRPTRRAARRLHRAFGAM
jgi:hypothetical protein